MVGAGITGLVAAFRLTQLGHSVRIFEQSHRTGGSVHTAQVEGWLIESGPNSLLSGDPALTRLIDELELTPSLVHATSAAKNRFVVRRGQLIPAPLSPPAFLASSLFSAAGKIRILTEALARRRSRTSDVSLAEFVRGHFGEEFVDYALTPFVGGVYAGDPERLSARHAFPQLWALEQNHGSVIRGQIAKAKWRREAKMPAPQIFSFHHGVQTLTDALVHRLPSGCIAFDISLEAITPGDQWSVIWNHWGATHSQSFDDIVVAIPGHALSQLRIGSLGERPLAALSTIEHPPLSSLFLGYKTEQVAHPLDGFGVLIPAVEKRSALGILFSSSLFPNRAPEGHVAITVMVGGTRQPELATLPLDQLMARVKPDLAELLGVRGDPAFVRHTFWPRAIPQYNLGYEQHLAAMTAVESEHPRMYIGGQARDGISLPACVAAGEKLAARLLD